MQTDLTKILTVSGQHGLFLYVKGGARNGAVVESLADKKRSMCDARNRITALSDISIYTAEGEVKLQEALLKLKEVLGEVPAPSSKAPADELKTLFSKALPDYDEGRFYVSHMRKVVDWYNELKQYASFDFVNPEEASQESGESGKAE